MTFWLARDPTQVFGSCDRWNSYEPYTRQERTEKTRWPVQKYPCSTGFPSSRCSPFHVSMNQARDDALPISVISQPLQQLVSDCFEEEQCKQSFSGSPQQQSLACAKQGLIRSPFYYLRQCRRNRPQYPSADPITYHCTRQVSLYRSLLPELHLTHHFDSKQEPHPATTSPLCVKIRLSSHRAIQERCANVTVAQAQTEVSHHFHFYSTQGFSVRHQRCERDTL